MVVGRKAVLLLFALAAIIALGSATCVQIQEHTICFGEQNAEIRVSLDEVLSKSGSGLACFASVGVQNVKPNRRHITCIPRHELVHDRISGLQCVEMWDAKHCPLPEEIVLMSKDNDVDDTVRAINELLNNNNIDNENVALSSSETDASTATLAFVSSTPEHRFKPSALKQLGYVCTKHKGSLTCVASKSSEAVCVSVMNGEAVCVGSDSKLQPKPDDFETLAAEPDFDVSSDSNWINYFRWAIRNRMLDDDDEYDIESQIVSGEKEDVEEMVPVVPRVRRPVTNKRRAERKQKPKPKQKKRSTIGARNVRAVLRHARRIGKRVCMKEPAANYRVCAAPQDVRVVMRQRTAAVDSDSARVQSADVRQFAAQICLTKWGQKLCFDAASASLEE